MPSVKWLVFRKEEYPYQPFSSVCNTRWGVYLNVLLQKTQYTLASCLIVTTQTSIKLLSGGYILQMPLHAVILQLYMGFTKFIY